MVSRLPPFLLSLFHYSEWICMQMEALPVLYLQGPEWDFLIPVVWPLPTLLLPSLEHCLISPLRPQPTIWSERLSQPACDLFVFAQLNHLQSANVVFLINSNRFCQPACELRVSGTNKQQKKCQKYQDRKTPIYKSCHIFTVFVDIDMFFPSSWMYVYLTRVKKRPRH